MSKPFNNSLWRSFACVFLALLVACTASPVAATPTSPASAALPEVSCTAVSSADRAASVANSPIPPPNELDRARGAADAQVTLIEYSDFQSPPSAQFGAVLAELETKYPQDLRVIYRHFPLIGSPDQPLHDKAAPSVQASEAAGRQGKFWEMHDLLFAQQAEWTTLSLEDFESWLLLAARSLELDPTQFSADLHSAELEQLAQTAWERGQELQLGAAPYLLINGVPYSGPLDIYSLDAIIQLELLRERQFSACPQMSLQAGASYTATISTEKGDIVVELFPEMAPMAVNSFIFLAEHDWFDNVTFHRVLPAFVAQAGDPTGTGYGGPGYAFAIEVTPNLTFDRAGLLAMANSGPTANGSQFFITLAPAEHLNGQFTIFGEVIQGMEVVQSLTPRDPSQSAGLPPGDLILDVTIEVH